MNILNQSFNLFKNKQNLTQTIGGPSTNDDTGAFQKSPRAVRSHGKESLPAFTILSNSKIPDLSESRKEDREERILNLLKRPKHKEHLGALYTSDKLFV